MTVAATLQHRRATLEDCARLAELNHQLIQDEGHRNTMNVTQLAERMREWLATEYAAIIFEAGTEVMAYALYRELPQEIYLRHLFVVRGHRREGIGRRAFGTLRNKIWPAHKRITVEALAKNLPTVAFWRSIGFQDYSLKLEILPGGTP